LPFQKIYRIIISGGKLARKRKLAFTIVDSDPKIWYREKHNVTFTGGFMQISLTFKKIDPSEPLKAYVQEKFDRLDKMLDNPAEAHVVLSVEKIRHIVEITLSCDGLRIHQKEASENMYASIDTLVDKLKLQIKKNKEKLRRHLAGDKQSIKNTGTQFSVSDGVADTPI